MAHQVPDTPDPAALRAWIAGAARVIGTLDTQVEVLARICGALTSALANGNKVLTAGNGGSAAEALHLAEELIGKYALSRRALPAICLNSDVTALTCIANDWDFSYIFARQIEALAAPGDVLVIFSTSGQSPNLLRACTAMRQARGTVVGLLGKGGGQAAALCDITLVVADTTAHIQEAHQVVLHAILEHVERAMALK